MTVVFLVGSILVFVAVIFAIYSGFSVKAALEWLGLKLSFEAQKPTSSAEKSSPTP